MNQSIQQENKSFPPNNVTKSTNYAQNNYYNILLDSDNDHLDDPDNDTAFDQVDATLLTDPIAAIDSGASKHYLKINSPVTDLREVNDGAIVTLPTGSEIKATHRGVIPVSELSLRGRSCDLFPGLTQYALIAVGQLCDDGCDVNFTRKFVEVTKNGKLVMKGKRNFKNGMYEVNIQNIMLDNNYINSVQNKTTPQINNLYHLTKTKEVIQYLHRCCFAPKTSTWCDAIDNGFFQSWPHLTSKLVRKYLPPSEATVKGHQHRIQQNLRSTKPREPTIPISKNITVIPQIDEISNKIYTDQTGRFPHKSSQGNQYIMVVYVYEANAILAEPLKNRSGATLLATYEKIYNQLQDSGFHPKLHILDNEASGDFKSFLKQKNVQYQLVPPHTHRRNAAERAIQTFKNHFISGLCSVDKTFPIHLWDRLLPQAVLTLNLLRPSRWNSKLSAYQQIYGNFDFNSTPLAPPGTKVIVHETPDVRSSWAPHGVNGFYIGPSLEHYRCYKCYIPSTRRERDSDTVEFFPSDSDLPFLSSNDLAAYAALDLIDALKNPHPATPLFVGDTQLRALTQLADIFASTVIPKLIPSNAASPRLQNNTPLDISTKPRVPSNTAANNPKQPRVQPRPKQTTTPKYNLRSRPINYLASVQDFSIDNANNIMNSAFNYSSDSSFTPFPPNDPYDYELNTSSPIINAIYHPKTGEIMTYRKLIKDESTRDTWTRSFANELGRLSNGVGDRIPTGTGTIHYIKYDNMPKDRFATYGKIVCEYKPHKRKKNRSRLVVGGDKIDYPFNLYTPTADITSFKCLINSVLSTQNAKFMTADIRDFYLNTPMSRYEYMKLPIDVIPNEIIEQYNLLPLVHTDNHVYIEIRKGMYGLPQAGKIANDQLKRHLEQYGYKHSTKTNGLWTHETRDTVFTLVVDDFGIKYTSRKDADHLSNALQDLYKITLDWTGHHFIGIDLAWNYKNRTCDLSMPGYVEKALERFKHKHSKITNAPSKHVARFGKSSQTPISPPPNISEIADTDNTFIEQVVGTFLYYGRAVDPTVLHALSAIATSRKHGMKACLDATTHLLNYLATHPNASLRYHASNMVLFVHSDASYLTEPEARSRVGGHFFLSTPASDPCKPPTSEPSLNGPILSECSVLRHVMSSAAEAELAGVFINAKNAEMLRQILFEMGHPQPPTPIQTDNTTACGIVTNTVKQRKTRAMDMRFYWLRDRKLQNKYHFYWSSGKYNMGDYYTKHHPPVHHKKHRPTILNNDDSTAANFVQGCISSSISVRTLARTYCSPLVPQQVLHQ